MRKLSNISIRLIILLGMVFIVGGCDIFNPTSTDVYYGGDYWSGSIGKPCYWKNGTFVPLSIEGYTSGTVNSIYISGNMVYAAGLVRSGSGPTKPCVWSSGTLMVLNVPDSSKDGAATSLRVYGNINVVGTCKNSSNLEVPCIWQNMGTKEPTILSIPDTAISGFAQAIQAAANTMIIAGYTQNSSAKKTPCIWETYTWGRTDYPELTTKGSIVNSLFIDSPNQYMGGATISDSDMMTPFYWIHGGTEMRESLPMVDPDNGGQVLGIWYQGGKVYSVGECYTPNPVPSLWVNYSRTDLEIPAGYSTGSARAVFVSGDILWVAGFLGTTGSRPCYWRNGTNHLLPLPEGADSGRALTVYTEKH